MSPRPWRPAGPWLRGSAFALVALNALLALRAATLGTLEATSGNIVAGGILLALLLAALGAPLRRRFPSGPVVRAQVVLLAASLLHAVGHVYDLYYLIPHYDKVFHAASGLAIGLVLLDFAHHRSFLFHLGLGRWRVVAFVVLAVTAVAGLWEVYEYGMDRVLGTREQDGLDDTMIDIGAAVVGAVGTGVLAWRYLRDRAPDTAPPPSAPDGREQGGGGEERPVAHVPRERLPRAARAMVEDE